MILSLVMTAGCFGGSRASSYTNSKSLSKYIQLAFKYASSGHWVETHKYLNLWNNDGWTPTKLYLTGMDALHKGKAVNRSGRSMSLSKDEKKLGLIFIYLSALGKFSMAESELGLLYSEGNYYLGKINVLGESEHPPHWIFPSPSRRDTGIVSPGTETSPFPRAMF